VLSSTSPGRSPAANSARALLQESSSADCGSKIGPGEVNSRPNEPIGVVTRPPNGSAALCSAGSSDLRSTGNCASAARLVTLAGSMPFRRSA